MILKNKFNEAVVKSEEIESGATARIFDLLGTRIVDGEKVVIMPNAKPNKSFVSGYTQTFSGEIIDPDMLGGDIFSGTLAIRFNMNNDLPSTLEKINKRESIIGFKKLLKNQLEKARSKYSKFIKYNGLGEIDKLINNFLKRMKINEQIFWDSLSSIEGVTTKTGIDNNYVWVIIKSGSGIIGESIWKFWKRSISKTRILKDEMIKDEREIKLRYKRDSIRKKEELKALHKSKKNVKTPSRFLCDKNDISTYLQDIYFAKAYSDYRRIILLNKIKKFLGLDEELETITTISNSIDLDDMIIRIGSSKSYENQKLLILTDSDEELIICSGLGNSSWNYSSPSNLNLNNLDLIKDTVRVNKIIELKPIELIKL